MNAEVRELIERHSSSEPERMVREAQANLALLFRYADSLYECPEGRVYINLLAEMSADAVDYAQSHSCTVSCSAANTTAGDGVEQDGPPAPIPPQGRAAHPAGRGPSWH